MRESCKLVVVFTCICLGFISTSANASLIFEIERVSDTVANITATGTLVVPDQPNDATNNEHQISFRNPFGSEVPALDNRNVFGSSTMLVGTIPIAFAHDLGPARSFADGVPWIYVGANGALLTAGSSVSGTLEWILPADLTLAAIGSTGAVTWGHAAAGVNTGTWTMVSSVPIPPAVWLFASGLLGLVGVARRKNYRTRSLH